MGARMAASARPKMGRSEKTFPQFAAKPLIGGVGLRIVRILAKKHLCRAALRVNSWVASGGKASGSGSNEFRSYRIWIIQILQQESVRFVGLPTFRYVCFTTYADSRRRGWETVVSVPKG